MRISDPAADSPPGAAPPDSGSGADSAPGAEPGTGADSAAGSVDRAITVLEIIARLGDASVSQVASEVGVHRSTISRLLMVLEGRDMVETAGARGRYRLGMNVLRLAGTIQSGLDLTVQGADAASTLATSVGETVNLAVLQGDSAVNIYQAEGGGAISATSWVGRPTPLHATSSGKVLLAFAAAEVAASALSRPLQRFTDRTITDPTQLRAELERARHEGVASTVGEFEVGLNAIAAPVRGPNGTVVAALSVSGPSYRLTVDRMRGDTTELVSAAAAISARMGHLH